MPDAKAPAGNPKEASGGEKLPLGLFPSAAVLLGSLAMLDGGLKYGFNNWRATEIHAMTYVHALERHVAAWKEGEECDSVSKVPHLGHALACLAIIVDARAAGRFVDDRPLGGGYLALAREMAPLVAGIRAAHAGKSPKHYYVDGGSAEPSPGPAEGGAPAPRDHLSVPGSSPSGIPALWGISEGVAFPASPPAPLPDWAGGLPGWAGLPGAPRETDDPPWSADIAGMPHRGPVFLRWPIEKLSPPGCPVRYFERLANFSEEPRSLFEAKQGSEWRYLSQAEYRLWAERK